MATKKFSPTKAITKINLENIPENKPGVYRIKNTDKDVLYVGIAKRGRLPDRIYEHKREFEGGTKFQYITTKSKEAAERIEKQEIKKYQPSENKDK